jgi:hypothetical protein
MTGFNEAGRIRMAASVLTMISPVSSGSAAFSAAVFPVRTGIRNSSTPLPAKLRTMSSVLSVEASESTRIWRRSSG